MLIGISTGYRRVGLTAAMAQSVPGIAGEFARALETAIKQWQDRAAQAETQLLQLIQDQIKRR